MPSSEKCIVERVCLLSHNVLFYCLCMIDLTFSFPKFDVCLMQVAVLWLVKVVTVLKIILQNWKIWSSYYLRLRVVFCNLRFQFCLDCSWLIYLRQVLVPLLLLLCWMLLLLFAKSYFFSICLLLVRDWLVVMHSFGRVKRLVICELSVHVCNLGLKFKQLVINCEHTIVDWLIQIHF